MASTDSIPVPRKNVAYRVVFPILDADGDLVTGAAGLDSEVSKDQGTFTDCTNEATEIATSSGMYYLDLTSTEMNADSVAVIVKTSTSGAKTTPLVIYPQETGDIKVDVQSLLGTAWLTPGTAGTPDVNVKLWNALTTVELPLVPTTAGRKLDVSAGGEAGLDWANVGSPTTALDLSGTTIKTTQKVDVDTIKTNPVVNGGTITFPTTATLASTTNITAGTVTTATNVTTVNGLAANVITATSIAADAITASKVADATIDAATFAAGAINAAAIASDAITAAKIADGAIDAATFAAGAINAAAIAADAITDAKVAADVTIASVTGAVGSVTGAVGSVTGAVGSVTGNVGGSVASIATGGIGAASFAAGAIDAAALAGDAIDEIFDEVFEGSTTFRQLCRGIAATLIAKASGLATTTAKYRDLADSKDRVTATVDADGNRSVVTLDLT